ncbi:endolytic transglycosylase MltG [Candidatus Saccharibacteria bacterium]|nr:endolytic transglycosylase MltG [Candidatus Saccharibacteria bacterium]
MAVLIIGGYGWYQLQLRAVGPGKPTIFIVKPGQSAPAVASDLATAKLIRSRNAFITYLNFHHLRGEIKAGSYALSPSDSSPHIANVITVSSSLGQVVIPEGYTIRQIETAVASHGISTASFEAALAEPHTQAGLSSKPTNASLEGYLFPDSYEVVPGVTTASQLVNTMLDTFTAKVRTTYDADFAAEGLTRHQGLTLASIVEKEVSRPEDRPIVAQVFLKRLKLGMPLGSDVTVDYGAAQLGTTFSTTLNSPYNTYLHTGLPIGPICNPGLSALDAVAHPAATDYLYFVAGSDGVTHFAATYAEHQANVAKYLK